MSHSRKRNPNISIACCGKGIGMRSANERQIEDSEDI